MIKGMLQGTDWIDPARPVVAGMYYNGQMSSWLVFLPFQEPNEAFRGTYGALAGEDYYVMRFPPVPEAPLPDAQRDYLLAASKSGSEANFVFELAAREALQQSESQIEAAIQNMAASAAAGSGESPLTPEEAQRLVQDFITTFKQVETLRFGLDLNPQDLLLLMDVQATPTSYLAGVLTDQQAEERLDGYRPNYPMQFRSRAYNVAGAMQMLGATFGQFYQKMGFDFEELSEIAKGLTGEMVGGMALDKGQMRFEMIYALHDAVNGDVYLNQVYLPWFEKYNRHMAAMMEKQTGQTVTPLYERMPDTTIAGHKVIGVRTRFPAMNPTGAKMPAMGALQDYQTRMTAVDGLVLMASSDAAITKMMAQVSGLQKRAAQGPLAEFSMDMGAYLRGLQSFMPDAGRSVAIPEDLGQLTMRAEMQTGTLTTRTQVGVQDLQQMISLLAAISSRMAEVSADTMTAAEVRQTTSETPPTAEPAPDTKNTPGYWMDRGGLFSAYGSYKAAARCFQKAIDLAQDMTEAYFQLGVAYGEMGRFEAAIKAISQAIDRQPTNGAYFYGRGRVYLLAGEEDLAMKDFMEAGFLGNQDARTYLRYKGVDWN
jgi:Flp pilus assembly protein TadD